MNQRLLGGAIYLGSYIDIAIEAMAHRKFVSPVETVDLFMERMFVYRRI